LLIYLKKERLDRNSDSKKYIEIIEKKDSVIDNQQLLLNNQQTLLEKLIEREELVGEKIPELNDSKIEDQKILDQQNNAQIITDRYNKFIQRMKDNGLKTEKLFGERKNEEGL